MSCSNQSDFQSFVGAIDARNGSGWDCDTPEDIMGGLKAAFLKLSWREAAAKVRFISKGRSMYDRLNTTNFKG